MRWTTILLALCCITATAWTAEVEVAVFEADVTPPPGSPLCGGSVPPAQGVADPLYAKGIVIYPEGKPPIVLCAVDWVGIANESHDRWRATLAGAAKTSADRVAVQTLHQHDAHFDDVTTERLLAAHEMPGRIYNVKAAGEALERTAQALRDAADARQPATHIGIGLAKVEKVASNRRILGEDGKVQHIRWSATADENVRALPEGVIDPNLKSVTFWNEQKPLAVLSWYATHPQSFYRTGLVSADFPGLARAAREKVLGIPQIHFNGAAGNVTAGKYNDGAPENRPVLAARLEDGMRRAFETAKRTPLHADDINWDVVGVSLPLREEVDPGHEQDTLAKADGAEGHPAQAARELAFIERMTGGHEIPVSCLTLGEARILHLPGELFIEYQLAAQEMAPQKLVCMAAYGDYGPGYIGTEISYSQGGYETQVYTSRTSPAVETVLHDAIRQLLAAEP